jgi:hypothetical protein
MTRELFNQMVRQCEHTIERFGIDKKNIHLISGGAAWSGTMNMIFIRLTHL